VAIKASLPSHLFPQKLRSRLRENIFSPRYHHFRRMFLPKWFFTNRISSTASVRPHQFDLFIYFDHFHIFDFFCTSTALLRPLYSDLVTSTRLLRLLYFDFLSNLDFLLVEPYRSKYSFGRIKVLVEVKFEQKIPSKV